ncbi:Gag-Pol polyprotein [Vitis vinifera]|uniref:Gag-Pol polyprotein n=1 Tax=Vitis vinifera TaxID=29760 RepID=A0A438JDP2_VITVI|nr:Gag-Pol polyprotein [Vitis vinifera]
MEVFGDSNLVLRQIQAEWKTRDVKLKPYHAYLELLVGRFDDLRYTHLPRAQNQFADALATLASMIDIPVNATVQPLLIESRSAPAYYCLIDDVEPDDGLPWYHDIYHFLRLGVYPEAATAKDKRALRQLATRFVICGETLYRRSPDGVLLLCLDRASADRVMREVHAGVCGPHMGGHMLAQVSECQIHGDLIHVPPSELHALTSPWPFSVWGIDIIGKISPKSSSGHEFILVAIDYFTKWVEVASYARLTSAGVASFIRSHIICRYGVPHELISDRGVHFRAEVDTLVQRYSIRHHRSSAYRPQTNGAVEAANKNIKRILRRMVETSRDWSEKLPFALWAYRTSFRTSTGATPYSLAYGMEAMLPVEIEMGSLRVALEQQIPEADWAQAQFDQLNLLDERRLRAADHVRAYQRKMARAFKKRVKPRPLHVGDLVLKVIRGLIRDPRGKVRPNWSGPYFIRELTLEGAVWLMDLDGNRFSEPTNVDQLKSDHLRFDAHFSSSLHISLSVHPVSFVSLSISYSLFFVSITLSPWPTLRPCLKTTLRPWDQMSSSAASTWAAPEIHPARSALLDTWMSSCLSIWGGAYFGSDEIYRSWGSRVPILIWRDIYRSPLVYMIIHDYGICARSMFDFILSGYSEEPLLSHSARFIPFYIVVIPGWSCLCCLDFPRHHFRGVHIRSVTRPIGVILGSSGQIGVPFSHFQQIEICSGMPHWESSSSLLSFGVQSHHHFLVSAFRAITVFTVRRSEPSLVFRLTFRVASSISTFRVVIASQFDVQGHHHRFLVSAFRAIIVFTVRRSEPSSVFRSTFRVTSSISTFRVVIASQFDVQGHHHRFLVSAFRAITVFTVRRSEPSSVFRSTFRVASSILTFRVVIASQFDVQSHHHHFLVSAFRAITVFSVRRSEPSSLFSFGVQSHHHFQFGVQSHRRFSVLAFGAIVTIFQFGVQSHRRFSVLAFRAITIFSLAFRAIVAFRFWRSEPSSLFSFGVQSHHYFQFGVQSHHRFSVLAFRAITILSIGAIIITIFSLAFRASSLFSVRRSEAIVAFQFWHSEPSPFSVWRSEPSSLFSFGVQSHHYFSVWRSEPSSLFSFGVRSHHYSQYRSHHHHFSVLAFGAINSFHSAFRAITTSQFRCPEPSPLLRLAFRAIVITPQFDVHSHIHQYRLSEPSSHLRSAFRAIVITSQFWRSEPSLLHSLFR